MTRLLKIHVSSLLILGSVIAFVSCASTVKSPEQVSKNEVDKIHVLSLDVYKPEYAFPGTTLLINSTDPKKPYIVEMDMKANVLWHYSVPNNILSGCDISKGADIEWLPANDHFLFVLPNKGIYEINRLGKIVWRHETNMVTHDADRLDNGNTIFVWGWDRENEAQVTEVNNEGEIVWRWFAKDHLAAVDRPNQYEAHRSGYFHPNSVTRLNNGNTLISLKEFSMVVEVNSAGEVVWSLDGLSRVHEPSVLSNGNLLLSTNTPFRTIEVTRDGRVVWEYSRNDIRGITYSHRLPNGNTIIVERTKIIEVSADREVVWEVSNKNVHWEIDPKTAKNKRLMEWVKLRHQWFYKVERLPRTK